MTPIKTARLIMRPWEERDGDIFFEINSDPTVMEFFSLRRSRTQSDAFLAELIERQKHTVTFCALELRRTGECMGFCGLHDGGVEPAFTRGTIEIGWRLATRFWGHGYATEAALAALDHGFGSLRLPEIVSFAVEANHRSTAVMTRIGMTRDPSRDFDHPQVSADFTDLKPHVVYTISRNNWLKQKRRP